MTVPSVIAFSGKIGSGKDYLAANVLPKVLNELYGPVDIGHIALADHLKYELAARNPDLTYEQLFVDKPAHVRNMLQQYGTEQGRDRHGDDVWIRAIGMRMTVDRNRHSNERPLIFVVTDARYENEVLFFEQLTGGIVIRVNAPERTAAKLKAEKTEHLASHRSEISLDSYKFSFSIDNDPIHEANVASQLKTILQHK